MWPGIFSSALIPQAALVHSNDVRKLLNSLVRFVPLSWDPSSKPTTPNNIHSYTAGDNRVVDTPLSYSGHGFDA